MLATPEDLAALRGALPAADRAAHRDLHDGRQHVGAQARRGRPAALGELRARHRSRAPGDPRAAARRRPRGRVPPPARRDRAQGRSCAGELWREVVATMPPIPSIALHDTIAAIGDFPRSYDFRSMAHEIPVMFDYPLCHPVPETLLGVDYINEYLRRLLIEADFLDRFDARGVQARARAHAARTTMSCWSTCTSRSRRTRSGGCWRGRTRGRCGSPTRTGPRSRGGWGRGDGRAAGAGAARGGECGVRRRWSVRRCGRREYLRALVPELLPRIEVGLARGDLRGVFVG